jgi:hypothetical protein
MGAEQSVRLGARPAKTATAIGHGLAIGDLKRPKERSRAGCSPHLSGDVPRAVATICASTYLWLPSQVDAVSGCSRLDCRFASRSGFTSAMAMAPPTSIMTSGVEPVERRRGGLNNAAHDIGCEQAGRARDCGADREQGAALRRWGDFTDDSIADDVDHRRQRHPERRQGKQALRSTIWWDEESRQLIVTASRV